MEPACRHRCLIYAGSPAQHLPALAATIVEKIHTNHRCLYLNSPAMVAGIRSYLAATGLDLNEQTQKGALVISSTQEHLVDGRFDVDRMIARLIAAVQQSERDRYAGLWASGDMAWEFGPERNFAKLLEYEMPARRGDSAKSDTLRRLSVPRSNSAERSCAKCPLYPRSNLRQ
jgi:hypothetical protein